MALAGGGGGRYTLGVGYTQGYKLTKPRLYLGVNLGRGYTLGC